MVNDNNLEHKKILVIEDEIYVAADIVSSIEIANGIVIGPATSVKRALQLLQDTNVDAAVIDSEVADDDVGEVIEILLAQKAFIVLYTGQQPPEDLIQHYDGLTILKKPAQSAALMRILTYALE